MRTPGGIRATLFAGTAAFGTFLVGLAILVGGQARFSAASFNTARQLAPWWAWGTVMLVAGLLAMVGASRHWMWPARVGHSLAGTIYLFLVFALTDTAIRLPATPLTGIGIYTAFAIMHTLAAATADEGRGEKRLRMVRRAEP
jgi:hypothetical protein